MTNEVRLYKEINFKDSQIGRIPRDWDIRKLGDESTADIIAGQSPSSSTYNKESRGLPFLQGKMEFGEMFPSPTTYCSEPIKVAKKDDVLLSVRAPVGDVNIAPFECCIGRGLAAIRPKADRLSHLYLFYYLKFEDRRFEALSTGSTFKAIRRQEIERFLIPVPSLVEQRAVVGVLGVVASAIGLVDEVIWKTERLKKGLMQQLLTRGIGHKEYKDTPIGKIPKEWEVTNLGSILTLQRGYDLPISKRLRGPVPVVGSNGIAGYHNRSMASGPGVIVGRSGSIGKAFYIEEDYWPLNTCLFVKEFKNSYPKFVYYLLQKIDLTKRLRSGTSVPTLNRNYVHPLKTAIPSDIREQQKIADILSNIDQKLEFELHERRKLEKIKRGLMDLLLTGKVRVKVD